MPAERYYIDELLEQDLEVALEGDECHHLTRVMRAKIDDEVELINGRNVLARARITYLDKNKAHLFITNIEQGPKKPTIILAQGICRFNRLEYILEKGTELNASEFWLFPAKLSEKTTFSKNQNERMRSLLIAAMKQSGRLDLPQILFKPPLHQWGKQDGSFLFGDTRHSSPPLWKLYPNNLIFPLIFAIGPEGGFTPSEISHLESLNAQGVRLHPNILRVDTAGAAALSLLSQFN